MFILPRFKKASEGRENLDEGGYLASASDLMIGLLFVFIIMVVILSMRITAVSKGDDRNERGSRIIASIADRLRKAGVPVEVDPKSGVISLPADTLFDSGKWVLRQGGVETLITARNQLAQIVPCYVASQVLDRSTSCPSNPYGAEIETIFIEGHTDSVPLNLGLYNNWHLALDRARTVYAMLVTNGPMEAYRNERSQWLFGVSSYADSRPRSDVDSENRRVELRFVLSFKGDGDSLGDQVVKGVQGALDK